MFSRQARTGACAVLPAGITFTMFACGTDETPDAAAATAVPSITSPTEATTSTTPKPTGASRPPDAPDDDKGGSGGCDTRRAGQLFRVRKAPEAEADGYGISNQGAYLQISAERGLIAEKLSDAPLRTVYSFVDNGAAPARPGS